MYSCKKDESSNSYLLNQFDQIDLNSTFNVTLIEDTIFSITAKSNEKRLKNLKVTQEGSIIRVDYNKKNQWLHPKEKVDLTIRSKPLKLITLNKSCFVQTIGPITSNEFGIIFKDKSNEAHLELACNVFYYWNNDPCGGILELKGTASTVKLWNTAYMAVKAKNLSCDSAFIENNSTTSCEISISSFLNYSLLNSGNIEIYGNPTTIIESKHSGTGKFILH